MSKGGKDTWDKCLQLIRSQVEDQSFKTWFEPIVPHLLSGATLIVQVPSIYFYEYLEEKYVGILRNAIVAILGPQGKLEYSIIVDKGNKENKPKTLQLPAQPYNNGANDNNKFNAKPLIKDKPLFKAQLNNNYQFENFIEGDCNRLARSAGLAVSNRPGYTSFNPLLFYGGVGLGKTHLAHAIGNKIQKNFPEKKIFYITSERFVNQFMDATQNNGLQDFGNFYLDLDVLILDDVQFFANKGKTQEMFFHIFNHLHQSGKQIILTTDRAPKDLVGFQDRLHSRFKWGLSADVQQPDFETKIAIINTKTLQEGIKLPDNVAEYLAYSVDTNVRDLEGVLVSLIAQSTLNRKEIDLQLTKEILRNLVHPIDTEVNIDYIQKSIAEYFDLSLEQLVDKTRKKEVVVARQLGMFFAKEYTNLSLQTIGQHFGKRDHSTVIHAINCVNDLIETDRKFKKSYQDLQKKLKIKHVLA
ncbi:MAG: chromosomal replication initiator protein DnaA [Opitutaceae bacterium]|nr:chromosomal replication initiator protein DnaA [Cytophagales bacterium]